MLFLKCYSKDKLEEKLEIAEVCKMYYGAEKLNKISETGYI